MENVAAGINACLLGSSVLVDSRTARNSVQLYAGTLCELVLGKKSAGKEKRIAFDILALFWNDAQMLVNLGNRNTFNSLLSVYLGYRVAEFERNSEVVQALNDVSVKSAGIRHKLAYELDICSFKRHSSRHNETDVSRAENDNILSGHFALYVDKSLRRARRIHACGAFAGNVELSATSFATAHRKHNSTCVNSKHSVLAVHSRDDVSAAFALLDSEHHSLYDIRDFPFDNHFLISVRVFGSCQLLAETMKPEAVVNTLAENSAEPFVTFDYKYILYATVISGNGSRHSRGASTYDGNIAFSGIIFVQCYHLEYQK